MAGNPAPADAGTAVEAVLALAAERAEAAGVEYLGMVTNEEALWLSREAGAQLVDVRSAMERAAKGFGANGLVLEWDDGEAARKAFLRGLSAKVSTQALVLFFSGDDERSHRAARSAARSGYTHACNVIERGPLR